MKPDEKISFINEKAYEHSDTNEKILWSMRALNKAREEELRKSDVENCLKNCIIIEDYSMEGRPLPGCLVLGTVNREPVHAVIAIDAEFDRIFIITVYRPSLKRWESDFKTRKGQ